MTRPHLLVAVAAVVVLGLVSLSRPIPVYISHPLLMLAIGYLVVAFFSAAILGPAGEPPPQTAPPIAQARCSGEIGWVPMRGSLKVTAHPDRLVVRMMLLGTRTIMAHEITAVRDERKSIRIEHVATGVRSPVLLYLRESDPLRQAVGWLWHGYPAAPTAHGGTRPDPYRSVVILGLWAGVAVGAGVGILILATGQLVGVAFLALSLLNGIWLVRWSKRTG